MELDVLVRLQLKPTTNYAVLAWRSTHASVAYECSTAK